MQNVTNPSIMHDTHEKQVLSDISQKEAGSGNIPPRSSGSSVPLSFGQQQVWLLTQLLPDVPVYHACITIHLPGQLDLVAFRLSLSEIIKRHEVWRTSFPIVDSRPIQLIHPPSPLPLPFVDLRHLPKAEREAEALRQATEEARLPFDLSQGAPLRAILMRLDDAEHRLFLTLHHIVFDSFSISHVFLPELHALYTAFSSGQPSSLPELPIQYADYTLWQRKWLTEEMQADQLAYWKQQLAGAPVVLELPFGRPRSPVLTYDGSAQPFALSRPLTDSLRSLSLQEGVTLEITLLAAFNTLLYRYTGQDDIVIGTTSSGRKWPEIQRLLGRFDNLVVMRTHLTDNLRFRALLQQVREGTLQAQAHGDVPFENLVKELQPKRVTGQNPLFQVLLMFESAGTTLPSKWAATGLDVTTGTSTFDLSLILEDRPEGLTGRFEYRTDLFDAMVISRVVGHWQMLLQGIVDAPDQCLVQLPLLTEKEQQLLVEWNATQIPFPRDRCIHQLFEEQVERTPEAIAVVFEGEQMTYRELNRRANQLARRLQHLGVGPDVLVGICVERSLDMVVGVLGIFKAGGAYVPLDPGFPANRIAFMLEDAQAPVLITQQPLANRLPKHGASVVCLDTDITVMMKQSESNLLLTATSVNLAYVIYTSGSTGRPKGVQIIHSAVVNLLLSMRQEPGLEEGDSLLAITTLSFDIAALELLLPLMVGARVIVAGRNVVVDGAALMETLARTHTTVMQATPATWRLLLAAGWQGKPDLKILCGGEALPLDLAQQLLPKVASLWNLYGPTETTIYSTLCKIEPAGATVTIGRPIANTQIYLLDSRLQPVPVGVPGEIFIGGDGLARGYLNRPELTSERFIPHPFSHEPGARLYRTGDLARYCSDGTIEHLGRLDFQVKVRGFRIELGEIEAVIGQHPAVRQAVVMAREDVPGDKHLVAYVILHNDQAVMIDDLKNHVMKQVPAYMVPSAFVLLEAFPLTPNNKVDRRALPAPELTRNAVKDAFVAPTLPVHHQLVQIWEELLGVHSIGIKDNFFDLGGHSLLAAHMIARIRQVYGRKIPLTTLFAGATIEHLAAVLMEEAPTSSVDLPVAVQTGGSRRPFFYLHGDWKGGGFYCSNLARSLGPDQPFYILEPHKFDGLQDPPTFEKMAASHIQSMRSVQPEGPYLLGGFCNGANMAYEMARQLQEEGVGVDLLILINPAPLAPHSRAYDLMRRFGGLIHLGQQKQFKVFLMTRYLQEVWKNRKKGFNNSEELETKGQVQYGRMHDALAPQKFMPIIPTTENLQQYWLGMYDWAALSYAPGLYAGKITLFCVSKELHRGKEWRKMIGSNMLEVHAIPGTHLTCRTTYLDDVAEQLRTCLQQVQNAELS